MKTVRLGLVFKYSLYALFYQFFLRILLFFLHLVSEYEELSTARAWDYSIKVQWKCEYQNNRSALCKTLPFLKLLLWQS